MIVIPRASMNTKHALMSQLECMVHSKLPVAMMTMLHLSRSDQPSSQYSSQVRSCTSYSVTLA